MYGFIHCCLQDLILKKFGEETWNAIIKEAGVNLAGGEYMIHRVYSDQETMNLVTVAQSISGIPLNDILETFGNHFYKYCKQSGYDRILKILGRTLREFLCNLDALHDHLASIYPGMNAPSFRASERPDGGLNLHYYSSREGLGYIVIGIMKIVARECLNTEIEIYIEKEKQGTDDHVVFAVFEKHASLNPSLPPITFPPESKFVTRTSTMTSFKSFFKRKKHFMSIKSFTEAFPFHVVFDKNLNLRQCGASISKYIEMSRLDAFGKRKKKLKLLFTDAFRLIRPKMEFTFQNILHHINTVFVVCSKHRLELIRQDSDGSISTAISEERKNSKSKITSSAYSAILSAAISSTSVCTPNIVSSTTKASELRLKGQMIYLPKTDCILFLCSPRVGSLEELERRGLYLSDFPLHDATREVILTKKEQQQNRQLVKRIEDSNNGLKILQSKLVHNKKITDELLHELLPPKVAQQLRLNLPVLAESYDIVTMLFSDLVGFTALCSNGHVVPMDIIKLLNKLYTMFDSISNMHNVYKVETIGDAYIGVCGIPQPLDDHAERIADMALDMIECVKNVISPVDSHPIKERGRLVAELYYREPQGRRFIHWAKTIFPIMEMLEKIRVGLHSGSCMAGVVGKKTPRYCLFGKHVTLANKMESGSSAGRVNVSVEARRYLNENVWSFEENTNQNPVECYFVERKNVNAEKEAEKHLFFKNLAQLDTHLKESSPAAPRKSPTPIFPINNNNNSVDADDAENNNYPVINNNNEDIINTPTSYREKSKDPFENLAKSGRPLKNGGGCPFATSMAK